MQFQRFATFNRKLLRVQHQRLASIRNLNHRNEIHYHKQFNNEIVNELKRVTTELKLIKKLIKSQ